MDDYFHQFDTIITLDGKQRKRLDSAASNVSGFLAEYYGISGSSVFLQGSYPNGTAIEPLDGGEYDLDIVAVCVDDGRSADKVLDDLADAFRSDGRFSERVNPKKPCVRLEYAEDEVGRFHVDVVPTRRSTSNEAPLDAPRRSDGWHETAPREFTQWCEQLGDRFARTVRALKRWRDENQTVRTAIKSIVLQVLAARHMPDIPEEDVRLAETIRAMSAALKPLSSAPEIMNPVLDSEDLAKRWTDSSFRDFQAALSEAEELVDEALFAKNVGEACSHWREMLGEDFPVPTKDELGIVLTSTDHAERPESRGWNRDIRSGARIAIDATWQRGKKRKHVKRLGNDAPPLLAGAKLRFWARTTGVDDATIWWQVVNTGGHARDDEGLRGEIFRGRTLERQPTQDPRENWENTRYTGSHLIRAIAVVGDRSVVAESNWFTVNIFSPGHRFRR